MSRSDTPANVGSMEGLGVARWTGIVSAHERGGFVAYGDYLELADEIKRLRAALSELDARLRECASIPATAADAYDSYYQALVAEALTPNV